MLTSSDGSACCKQQRDGGKLWRRAERVRSEEAAGQRTFAANDNECTHRLLLASHEFDAGLLADRPAVARAAARPACQRAERHCCLTFAILSDC